MRRVTWLGQAVPTVPWVACGPDTPCPDGSTCVSGACVPNRVTSLDPNLLRAIKPVQPKKTDNTVLYVLGGVIGLGVLYYAMQ